MPRAARLSLDSLDLLVRCLEDALLMRPVAEISATVGTYPERIRPLVNAERGRRGVHISRGTPIKPWAPGALDRMKVKRAWYEAWLRKNSHGGPGRA
jgi:hypothetical protein